MPRKLFLMGLVTLLGFGLAGYAMVELVQQRPFLDILRQGYPLEHQLLVGIVVGLFTSLIAVFLISRTFFQSERRYYRRLIQQFPWSPLSIVFVSLCAGVGEEVFFRAGLQPLMGIWWTSVLFVGLHGYLNPRNWRISVYGAVMVCVIAGFGYLFQLYGLWSSIAAHAVFDVVLITWMIREKMT